LFLLLGAELLSGFAHEEIQRISQRQKPTQEK
jgi:hypothetical protein